MSKLVLICQREPSETRGLERRLTDVCALLRPDNIMPNESLVTLDGALGVGLFNPNPTVAIKHTSVCLGHMTTDADWHRPGAEPPRGTYALFRSDSDYVEVLSDAVATRTIWYYHDENQFIAATSQRAIVALIGSFQFNEAIIPWMLATGSLGPHGWDERIRKLPGNASVSLDRRSWRLEERAPDVFFEPAAGNGDSHKRRLVETLRATLRQSHLEPDNWVLPLSGGYDSRGILCLLGDHAKLRTITWGLGTALGDAHSDATVARELARHFGLQHTYFETDVVTSDTIESLMARLLVCGEGRTDALAAYMDGFAIWKSLFEQRIFGIIRGDEAFGWIPVVSEYDVRMRVGTPLVDDFANVEPLTQHLSQTHTLPSSLTRRTDESLEQWRDRLYHQYRIPNVLAALSDLKLPYVELVNPLLSHDVILAARQLPDAMRTNKALFRSIVEEIGPDIAFASDSAIASPRSILSSRPVTGYLLDELSSAHMKASFPQATIEALTRQMRSQSAHPQSRYGVRSLIRTLVPRPIRHRLRGNVTRPKLDPHVLGFRVFLIGKMRQIFDRPL